MLEQEAVVAEDVLVLGSLDAQRAGQQLTTGQRAVFSRVSPVDEAIVVNADAVRQLEVKWVTRIWFSPSR